MLFLIVAFISRPHSYSVLLWCIAAYLTQLAPSVLHTPRWKGKPDQAVPWSGNVAEMVTRLHLHNLIPICPHFLGCHVVVGTGCCCSSCCSLVTYFSFCFQFFLVWINKRAYLWGCVLPITAHITSLVIAVIHASALASRHLTTKSDRNYLLYSKTGWVTFSALKRTGKTLIWPHPSSFLCSTFKILTVALSILDD